LYDFINKADWGRFSVKIALFFGAYGVLIALFVGPLVGMSFWPCVLAFTIGACLGGYLVPRTMDFYGRGPLMSQMANGFGSGLFVTLLFAGALSYFGVAL